MIFKVTIKKINLSQKKIMKNKIISKKISMQTIYSTFFCKVVYFREISVKHHLVFTKCKVSLGCSRARHLRLCLVFGKYKGKKKNAKENDFLMFGYPMKNIKENQI